jgi:hypothetical protein
MLSQTTIQRTEQRLIIRFSGELIKGVDTF